MLCVLIDDGMSVVVNVMLSLMRPTCIVKPIGAHGGEVIVLFEVLIELI